ncbi:hypothetical protein R2Q81_11530 [Microbacterium aquimaris]|uniref:hypothetical protein n=1 Tax=Microbacterium aquimaris TaxID=459816 RepID=UPI002AD4A3C0|nr:hypothetical protein [Microbacterium aquimaris]MDZ8276573.1 hypothetical protein [Microbacterium aquimaris]
MSVEENAVMVGSFVDVGTPKTHENRSVPSPRFLDDAISATMEGKGRDDPLWVMVVFTCCRTRVTDGSLPPCAGASIRP